MKIDHFNNKRNHCYHLFYSRESTLEETRRVERSATHLFRPRATAIFETGNKIFSLRCSDMGLV